MNHINIITDKTGIRNKGESLIDGEICQTNYRK